MPQRLRLSDFRAVLFDVDGTLVDSLETIVRGLGDTFERYLDARPSESQIRSLIGTPLSVQLRHYSENEPTPERLQEMTEFSISRFEHHSFLEKPFRQAVATLQFCRRRGLRTALVTSKSAREVELFLPRFLGDDAADTVVSSSDVKHPKPDPECAWLACERLGVTPNQAIFIGDSVFDIRCAKSAGMSSVAVSYGAAPKETLLAEHPDALFETPEALMEWAEASFLETPCPERS